MSPAFDAMAFWATVVCLLLILLVGCVAEVVVRIAERSRKVRRFMGEDSCLDAIADQD